MGGSISSDDAAAVELDSQAAFLPQEEEPDDQEASQEAQPAAEASGAAGSSGPSGLSPGTFLGAEVPSGLLAIENAKPDEYYQAADQIRGALDQPPDQLQQITEQQLAEWVHSTEGYPETLFMLCEYAFLAREQVPGSTWMATSSTTTCTIRMRP